MGTRSIAERTREGAGELPGEGAGVAGAVNGRAVGVNGRGVNGGGVNGGVGSGVSGSGGSGAEAVAGAGGGGAVRCVAGNHAGLVELARAIQTRVGALRFTTWFDNSTRFDLRNDGLEIAVPDDFTGEWIGQKFTGTIQEAAVEVFGGPLRLRFQVVPELFGKKAGGAGGGGTLLSRPGGASGSVARGPAGGVGGETAVPDAGARRAAARNEVATASAPKAAGVVPGSGRARLRHDLASFVVGPGNQLAYNAAVHVAQYPGSQYNPLFVHGACGLGKTHLLQGLCQKFVAHHPTKKWAYMTGEEFTNEYLLALRTSKVDGFRRKMRELDLLVIDDVHFLSGKKATQEEFLHTFNAIEALGRQVVMASDAHPKEISEFGESLVNRFVSGMVVRVDPPNLASRCEILRRIAARQNVAVSAEVVEWIAKRVTQNVRELEGALTRVAAHVQLTGRSASVELAQEALGELDRAMVAPVKPENVLAAVASHFGLEAKELMSGRRHHTVSLARSVAMYLVRKTAKLSYPEIGARLGNRNHSTVISACRRVEAAVNGNETLTWSGALGERAEEAAELVQRLEEAARAGG